MPQAWLSQLIDGADGEESENEEEGPGWQEGNDPLEIGEQSREGPGWQDYGGGRRAGYSVMSTGKSDPASRPSSPA
jgi:hypothetical protein